tara:strand:+ start:376 stop:507 length:132 start_codon:yes stop_codon:yes gene_type:complete
MPTYLRNFYVQQLLKVKNAEKKGMDKVNKGDKGKIHRSNIPQR